MWYPLSSIILGVKATDFHKLNKKHVTKDFVGEKIYDVGWTVFKQFVDTGIDRIIMKSVFPNSHAKFNEKLDGKWKTYGSDPSIINTNTI